MSAPELRDGDTIFVRATVRTFNRQLADGTAAVPMVDIGDSSLLLTELAEGWCVEDRKIAKGDRVTFVKDGRRQDGEVVAVSPPEVTPAQFWVRVDGLWPLFTFIRTDIERVPPL